jgi:hypothetical protein
MSAARAPLWTAGALLALAACGPPARPDADAEETPADATPGERDASAPRCRPGAGVSSAPGSIAAVVALVNALPHPVSLPCLLESLDRPLLLDAARGSISLQPGVGTRSPRLFLFVGPLIMSVVPEGRGHELLELGEQVGGNLSLKAELAFPIAEALTPAHPFDEVRAEGGTTCGVCHGGETRAETITFAEAYVSSAFRPRTGSRVSRAALADERQRCDAAAEPARCAILGALFDHGEVEAQAFPTTFPTIGD